MRPTVKFIRTDILNIAYLEYGTSEGAPLILLHGFPYDVHAFDEAIQLLMADQNHRWHIFVPWLRGYGETRFLSDETMRSGEQSALAWDLLSFINALGISKAFLAGFDWGGRAACIVSALFPERVLGLVSCGVGYNIQDAATWQRPTSPESEIRMWYMYYLNTERGKNAITENRNAFCKCLWKLWSPTWNFAEETFLLTAAAFENEDFPAVVTHSYRCRIGEAPEDPLYQEIAAALKKKPVINVPTIVLLGMDDSVTPPPAGDAESARFGNYYQKVLIPGVGHNVPQEAPARLVEALRSIKETGDGDLSPLRRYTHEQTF